MSKKSITKVDSDIPQILFTMDIHKMYEKCINTKLESWKIRHKEIEDDYILKMFSKFYFDELYLVYDIIYPIHHSKDVDLAEKYYSMTIERWIDQEISLNGYQKKRYLIYI